MWLAQFESTTLAFAASIASSTFELVADEGPGATIWDVATLTYGDFEWDTDKATANVSKHGVAFEDAVTVFLDLDYLLVRDAVVAERFVAIRMSAQARILFVVHCERGERLRIISARRATRRERETYDRRRTSD